MSTELKNKIYDFEEIPPAMVWENVALSLDEYALQKNLFNKLNSEEVAPPAVVWARIINTLDEESADTKLREAVLKLEMQPPTITWNKISLQLDKTPQETLSKKMYEYEVMPPETNWEKIAQLLDIKQITTPVIPLHKSYNRIIRVAAAAAIIGIIAWAGFRILNNADKSANNELTNKEVNPIIPTLPVQQSVKESTAEIIIDNNKKVADKNLIAAINPAKSHFKKTIKSTRKNGGMLLNTLTSEEDHATSNDIAVADIKNLHKKNTTTLLPTDNTISEPRYLVYLTEQGDMVKLSKKMADLTCIYTKDGSISQGALAKLDASQCNDQVKYWQEKMANSSMQSSSNPLELIEILK